MSKQHRSSGPCPSSVTALSHYEKWDGSGYPQGVAEDRRNYRAPSIPPSKEGFKWRPAKGRRHPSLTRVSVIVDVGRSLISTPEGRLPTIVTRPSP